MRTGRLRSKLVTDSLGRYIVVFRSYVCMDSSIVGFEVGLDRLFGVGVGTVSSSVGHSVGEID